MVPVEAPHEIDLTDSPSPVVPRGWVPVGTPIIVVGIVDEHEMFALGIRTCLAENPLVKVAPVVDEDVDVVIVSPRMAEERRFAAPLVICGELPKRLAAGNEVMAVLGRATLTADHLVASIHAAAAGLRVVHEDRNSASSRLAGRGLEVLSLLASGADTKEIAEQLGYSDRTIKSVIRDVQQLLGVKNRVQAVAEGIRQGLI
jgi:DNA-binding CsgD family transcriptional regulator